ncbi:hypothetical protein I3842_03G089800 [Carya illinoinensis]|uniref:DUF7610 domain-containing protein n=1 Tax=Carya illinoinensis TaxID=32201 RepID=A0A922FIR0_CARIL|nr:hypothetical protein I3842_03G089800 [Carya illinoinensis]
MTKRYSILQKKLQELESELNRVYSLAAQTQTPCPDAVLEDIHQKFVFVSNLLSAELASGPSKPHHLYHIARRLSELERAFLVWDGRFKTSALNFDDNASTCSCSTESYLDDDGEASDNLGSPVYYEDDPERFSQVLQEEKALVEFGGGHVNHDDLLQAELLDCLVEKGAKEGVVGVDFIEKDVKGKQKKVGISRLCGAMAGGVLVLGMALMGYAMGRFYGCFYYVERPGCFLSPT